ncbi:schlafen family member 13 [Astyanax mexicanus]|uniref:schlafen family member 13 n=1 Tax=Astyanax mexicanus TaxID=7994 RepID=UPI0020CAA025|nr:schlafen family member 13 [Astyanax mexicanus]
MALSKPDSSARYWRSSDQYFNINKCTFGEQARNKIDKAKRTQQSDVILQCVCALLNSGGGVISAGVENEDYCYCTMSLGQDLEEHLLKLLDVPEDFIEFVQSGNALHMYVKSWCSHDNRARLCSVHSGLRKRAGTKTPLIHPSGVLDFIKKKRQTLYLGPPAKRTKWIHGDEIYNKAQEFYEKREARLGQILDFGESVNVELKSFAHEKNLKTRLNEKVPKYLSAFGNTKGGFLFIGVDDRSKTVIGCGRGMDAQTMEQMIQEICNRAQSRAFHFLNCARKEEWSVDYEVFEVMENSGEEPRYIFAVKVQAFCCAVFEDDPKCWHIENDTLTQLDPESWLKKMQGCDPGDPDDDLSSRFNKVLSLKDSPPQCRAVYSIKDIATLQERVFSVQGESLNIMCKYIPQELLVNYPNLLTCIQTKSGPGILIMSTSWAIDVNLPRNKSVICEALLISTDCYPTLFCWAEGDSPELWQYVNDTAFSLKQKLVNLGGYTGRLCVIPRLVNCQTGEVIQNETDGAPPYPDSYTLNHVTVQALLRSLTTVVMSISSPLSDTLGCEFFNLLTEEQYDILHKYNGIKHLFIHGPPGSGKTLIAMEKIRMIKNSDNCEDTDILYLCENVGLRDFVRKQSKCLCETRAGFMRRNDDNFFRVKHIIVDEGQNFRLEHGDWYQKANSLVQENDGIFWIFVDYFQRSHTSSSGLPPLNSQSKAFLYEVVRNSEKVFDAMLDLIHQIAENLKPEETAHFQDMVKNVTLSHSFRGQLIRRTNLPSVETNVVTIIRNLLKRGHSAKDIAVLYSTLEELDNRVYSVKKQMSLVQFGSVENIDEDVVVLDTIRRFSGLERNIVILVDPSVHPVQNEVEVNVHLSAFSRARIRLYVLQSKRSKLTPRIPWL